MTASTLKFIYIRLKWLLSKCKRTHNFNLTVDLVLTYDTETEHLTAFPEKHLLSDHFLISFKFTIMHYTAAVFITVDSSLSESAVITSQDKIHPLLSSLMACVYTV